MKNHIVEDCHERTGMVHPSSRLLRLSRDELIYKLFSLMSKRQRDVGDWELRAFSQAYPKCVDWKHPQKEMVPLLYAFDLNSPWLVRHFIQMDSSKIHEKDKWGRDASEIVFDTGQRDLLVYAMMMLGDNPPDVHATPLILEDPLKGIPNDLDHVFEINSKLDEVLSQQAMDREERERNKNKEVVFSFLPKLSNNPN